MNAITRMEMKDWVRRIINGRCLFDDTSKPEDKGKAFDNQPRPSNQLIEQCIDTAVSEVNRKVRFGSRNVTLNVAAQTANGPYQIPLETFGTQGGPQINIVRSAWWTDSSSVTNIMRAKSVDSIERDNRTWQTVTVGTPREYWVEGYILNILPGNSTAGTVSLRAGIGMVGPSSDSDTIHEIPADYIPVFMDIVVALICAQQPDDAVFADRMRYYGPKAEAGKEDIASFFNDMAGQLQASLTYRSNRIWSPVPVRRS